MQPTVSGDEIKDVSGPPVSCEEVAIGQHNLGTCSYDVTVSGNEIKDVSRPSVSCDEVARGQHNLGRSSYDVIRLLSVTIRYVYSPAHPTLGSLELIKWKSEKGQVKHLRIKESICNEWRVIGHLLGIPHYLLDAWGTTHGQNPLICIDYVLSHWIEEKSNKQYSVSWKGLYELLIDIQCSEIAYELQRALHAC